MCIELRQRVGAESGGRGSRRVNKWSTCREVNESGGVNKRERESARECSILQFDAACCCIRAREHAFQLLHALTLSCVCCIYAVLSVEERGRGRTRARENERAREQESERVRKRENEKATNRENENEKATNRERGIVRERESERARERESKRARERESERERHKGQDAERDR